MAKFTVAILLAIVAVAFAVDVIPLHRGYTSNYYTKAQPHGPGYSGLYGRYGGPYGGYGLGASRFGLGYGYGVGVPGYGLGAFSTYPLGGAKGYRHDGRDHARLPLGLY